MAGKILSSTSQDTGARRFGSGAAGTPARSRCSLHHGPRACRPALSSSAPTLSAAQCTNSGLPLRPQNYGDDRKKSAFASGMPGRANQWVRGWFCLSGETGGRGMGSFPEHHAHRPYRLAERPSVQRLRSRYGAEDQPPVSPERWYSGRQTGRRVPERPRLRFHPRE